MAQQLSPHEQAILKRVSDCAPKPYSFRHYLDRNIAAKLAGQGYLYTCTERGEDGEFPYLLSIVKGRQALLQVRSPEEVSEEDLLTLFGMLPVYDPVTINDPSNFAMVDILLERGYVTVAFADDYGQRVIRATELGAQWYGMLTLEPAPKPAPKPAPETGVDAILAERQTTYGEYRDVAYTAQLLKASLLKATSRNRAHPLEPFQAESLDMICNKLARIVNGDPNYIDSWKDVAGFAQLVVKELEKTEGATDAKVTRTKVINGKMVNI